MARTLPSPADRELLDAAKAAGYPVSPFQLERWRMVGLVPRNVRRGLGRGRGTVSVVPEGALVQLIAVAKRARQGRALVPDQVFARVVNGRQVPDAAVRSTMVKLLGRLTRHLAVSDTGDAGWQTRYERARRGAGRTFDLDMLMPDSDVDLLADEDTAAWRDATATMAHAFAGDVEGISGEDLTRAMVTIAGKLSPDEVSPDKGTPVWGPAPPRSRSARLDGPWAVSGWAAERRAEWPHPWGFGHPLPALGPVVGAGQQEVNLADRRRTQPVAPVGAHR